MGGVYGGRVHYPDAGGLGVLSGQTSTLPGDFTLGEERIESGVRYKLFYNAGGASIPTGNIFGNGGGSTGIYSVTVTTTSDNGGLARGCNNTGRGNTITTANYFWGAVEGEVGKLTVSNVSIATDHGASPGVGVLASCLARATGCIGINLGNSNGTGATDTLSGDFYVFFD